MEEVGEWYYFVVIEGKDKCSPEAKKKEIKVKANGRTWQNTAEGFDKGVKYILVIFYKKICFIVTKSIDGYIEYIY